MKRIFLMLVIALSIYSINAQDSLSYVENELIIWLEKGVDGAEFAANSSEGIVSKDILSKRLNIWLFEFINGTERRNERMNKLSSSKQVKHVQNNHYVSLRSVTPDDTHYRRQWAPEKIQLPEAWGEFTTGGFTADGDEIVIAVVDAEFDLKHDDIDFWKNTNEIPNNGIDDDNNGYIDDYDGWNAFDQNGDIYDGYYGHGTQVSGIAGAIGNNDTGICGVNWNVKIMPIVGASSRESTVVKAYEYVADMRELYNETNGTSGAFIVASNSSFGLDGWYFYECPLWCAMYDELGSLGILNCAATANRNTNVDVDGDIPTTCPSDYLIAVTNTTQSDTKAPNAAYGIRNIDIGAPGTEIYTTFSGNGYGTCSNTSYACPHVTGVIALMYAAMSQNMIQAYKNNPANMALIVKQYLLDGADNIPALNQYIASGRRLNAYKAVFNAACREGIEEIATGSIEVNTVWNTNKYGEGTLTIEYGTTLTVNSQIRCAPDFQIIVQPGGKLVINGGKLTNACPNRMWQGIIVLGEPRLPQLSQNQGKVELKNNAVIEHAICAISAAPEDYEDDYGFSTGGIIQATDAIFQNNLCAIEYQPYENRNSGTILNNVGYFSRCTFVIDPDNLFAANGVSFEQHVKMDGVRGIEFIGCNFENQVSRSGKGIYAFDAGFKIRPYCPVILSVPGGTDCPCDPNYKTPILFKNLNYGIQSVSTDASKSVYIDQSNFDNNHHAVDIEATHNYRLTRTNFENIGYHGLRSGNSSGYRIEENDFDGTSKFTSIGIEMNNSGSANNQIYRNYFNNLLLGIYALSSNSNRLDVGWTSSNLDDIRLPAPSGLQFLCNQFSNIDMGIGVEQGATVHPSQGSQSKGANNKFSSMTHSIYLNNMQCITYFHSGGAGHSPFGYVFNNCSIIVNDAGNNICASKFCVYVNETKDYGSGSDLEKYKILQEEYDILAAEFEKNEYGHVIAYPDEYPKDVVAMAMECLQRLQELQEVMYVISMENVHVLVHDSILYVQDLKEWYKVIRTPVAKYSLAELHFMTKDWEKADALLKIMPEMFQFEDVEMKEHDNYLKFFNLKTTMTLDERTWDNLFDEEIEELEYIAQATCGRSATMAQGVLCFFYDNCKEYEECNPKELVNPKIAEAEEKTTKINESDELIIRPNPTTGEIQVQKFNGSKVQKLSLFDIFGSQVLETTETTFDIAHLSKGVYIIRVFLENGEVVTRKIVKQ